MSYRNRWNVSGTLAVTGVVVAVLLTSLAWSQSGDRAGAAVGTPSMPCDDVVVAFRVMQQEITELDQKLYRLVEEMQAADDATRFDATAAVIEEMALQRAQIRQTMKLTHQHLVRHLLEHLLASHVTGDDTTITTCPVLATLQLTPPDRGAGAGGDRPLNY